MTTARRRAADRRRSPRDASRATSPLATEGLRATGDTATGALALAHGSSRFKVTRSATQSRGYPSSSNRRRACFDRGRPQSPRASVHRHHPPCGIPLQHAIACAAQPAPSDAPLSLRELCRASGRRRTRLHGNASWGAAVLAASTERCSSRRPMPRDAFSRFRSFVSRRAAPFHGTRCHGCSL